MATDHVDVVRVALEYKSNVNSEDSYSRTPWQYGVVIPKVIIPRVLDYGVVQMITHDMDAFHRTPLYTVTISDLEIIRILLQ